MFDLIQTGVNVCENRRAEEAIDAVTACFENGGAPGVMFGLTGAAVPVVTVTENDGFRLWEQEVGNSYIAKRHLFLTLPSARNDGSLCDPFNVGAFVVLVRKLPNCLAGIRASHSRHFAGVRSYLFATDTAGIVRHILRPIGRIVALSLVVPATAGTKAYFAAWLFSLELLAAGETNANNVTRANAGGAYLLPMFF